MDKTTRLFENDNEIQIGTARVIWTDATTRNMAGWALPGGAITDNRARAVECCEAMSEILDKRESW